MVVFNVEQFAADPTLESLDECRKDDLLKIAAYYHLPTHEQDNKRDIKAVIVAKLFSVSLVPQEVAMDEGRLALGTPRPPGPDEQSKSPDTLPKFESPSPGKGDPQLKVRLARLQIEAEERESKRQIELKLEIRRIEVEADKAVKMHKLQLEAQGFSNAASSVTLPTANISGPVGPTGPPSAGSATPIQSFPVQHSFDVSKNISLVPQFRENEVDSYFSVFERIAAALKWPPEVWPLLLQCKLSGKAQEVIAALPLEESLKYESVKAAIMRAYELVPEAYRQKFRNLRKTDSQTYAEFAREKCTSFDKWCTACKVSDFNALREMLLLEEFKRCLPERIVTYLNEQKVTSLNQAAISADEFVLTHKSVFRSGSPEKAAVPRPTNVPQRKVSPSSRSKDERECYYCHRKGHVLVNCLTRKRREQEKSQSSNPLKPVGLIKTVPSPAMSSMAETPDSCFKPFMSEGFVSLTGESSDEQPVRILRDTGGAQSVMLTGVLPFTSETACGASAIVQGIEMGFVPMPLHRVFVKSKMVTGFFNVAVCPELPVKGVEFLLCNDIAGGKVTPTLEVYDHIPECIEDDDLDVDAPEGKPSLLLANHRIAHDLQ